MNYYYINTEAKAFNGFSPHNKWIELCHAFTSGDKEKYGLKVLGKLEPDDICFMYANKCGIVAVGRVCKRWNGCSYEGADRWIYRRCDEEYTEYRIPVDWYLKLTDNPIRIQEIRRIFGWAPRGWGWRSTLGPIRSDKTSELLGLVQERMEFATQEFFDLDKDSPLYEDLEDIFKREKTNQLRWFSHTDVWNE